jgi:hypothetical protein
MNRLVCSLPNAAAFYCNRTQIPADADKSAGGSGNDELSAFGASSASASGDLGGIESLLGKIMSASAGGSAAGPMGAIGAAFVWLEYAMRALGVVRSMINCSLVFVGVHVVARAALSTLALGA